MLNGLTVLIVEDESFIALDLAAVLEAQGVVVIGPVPTVAEALAQLDQTQIAAAILDANLIDRDITPVAVQLVQRHVPFVIHSATGLPDELKSLHPDLPLVMKPAPVMEVVQALAFQIETPRG